MITYFALDLKSKKFYIGSTDNTIEERLKGHKKEKDYPFQRALNKRPETFFWVWGTDDLNTREEEQFYLDFYFGSEWCYNLNPMASVPPSWRGKRRSEENKRKVAESKRGKTRPDVSARMKSGLRPQRKSKLRAEEIARFIEMAKRPKSQEHRRKQSEKRSSLRGYNNGSDYRYFVPGSEPKGWVPGKPKGDWKPIERDEHGRFKTKQNENRNV